MTDEQITIGSLFSGIGGLELGLGWAGLGPVVWQVERDPFCLAVLAKHWPEAERFTDVRTVPTLSPVDLICGGFPCQDVSSAGGRAGLSGSRSGLWYQFARIVGEMRPRWVVVENVARGANAWVDAVRANLEELGYASLPVPVAASDCGAPHCRARVFLVAHVDGRDNEAVARCEKGLAPHALPSRRQGPGPGAHQGGIGSSAGSWWPSLPDMVPVVHGLSGGLAGRGRRERIRALGNSVVPQCAEVVGHVIRRLASA